MIVLGDAIHDELFTNLIKKSKLKKGAVLNDGDYELLKSNLTSLAIARGYFDATINKHSIKVYLGKKKAIIDLTFNSGKRYTFGNIYYGNIDVYVKKLLNKIINIKTGEPYNSVKLGKLAQELFSTDYFSHIDIHPGLHNKLNNQVPLYIQVTPKVNNQFEVGAGFSTDEGARVSANWKKPWVNHHGHSLTNEIKISNKVAELTYSYKIPKGNPLQDYYDIQLGYQKKNFTDTNSDLLSASINNWRKSSLRKQNSWDQDIFFRAEYESYTQGAQEDSNLLFLPGISLSRRRIKGGLDAYWGDKQLAKIEASNKAWGSSVNFLRFWGQSKWVRTYFEKHLIMTRIEQGAILQLDDITQIPPSFRFFVGGDQSIRGYSYESISPRDKNGKLTGGRYITTSSFQYAYPILPKWRLAAFIDAGTATNNYKDPWKVGVGFGIHWLTPVGPLKVDLAFAVSEDGSPWQVHFIMGPEL